MRGDDEDVRAETKICAIDFSADGLWLAVGGAVGEDTGDAFLVSMPPSKQEAGSGGMLRDEQHVKHEDCVRCLAFSPDSSQLLTAGDDQTMNLQQIATKQALPPNVCLCRLVYHPHSFFAFVPGLASDSLCSYAHPTHPKLMESNPSLLQSHSHSEAIVSVAFARGGSLVVTAARGWLPTRR